MLPQWSAVANSAAQANLAATIGATHTSIAIAPITAAIEQTFHGAHFHTVCDGAQGVRKKACSQAKLAEPLLWHELRL